MTGNTDPRVEAAADAITYHPGNRGYTPESRHRISLMLAPAALAAADAADRAAGIVRLRVDDETVERVARALFQYDYEKMPREAAEHMVSEDEREGYRRQARTIFAVLRGEP